MYDTGSFATLAFLLTHNKGQSTGFFRQGRVQKQRGFNLPIQGNTARIQRAE